MSTHPISFTVHTPDSAPSPAGDSLHSLAAAVGRIPSLAATMAESPSLIRAFLTVREVYASSGFTPKEIETLSIVSGRENGCAWCVAFHTAGALRVGLDTQTVDALRAGNDPADPRLGALARFARRMVQERGNVGDTALADFVAAGFAPRQALDVVLGMAFSLMANYAGKLTHPPVDDFIAPYAWAR
jgi:AhpD family alkylhydroperoxidase